MITCDSSVLVAAFARWHEGHRVAAAALARVDALIDHVVIETYSVLTRLPPPCRVAPALVVDFLDHHFPAELPRLNTIRSREALQTALARGVSGGAVYDLLIALTAGCAGAGLMSLDRRAASTYEKAGISFELLD